MNQLPEIRIKNAWLLRENTSVHLNELWGDGKPLRSERYYEKIAEQYEKAWKPYENKILKAMSRELDLEFRQNIIDVYIAPWFFAFSDPMIIGVIYEPDEFIDILTHELIHRLLTDNRTLPYDLFLIPHWENLFGKNHSFNTLVHIPVHAVHKAVYLDALKDAKRLERDIKRHQKYGNKDYTAAWDYVESRGYEDIIACLKRQCQVLGKKK